MTMPDVTGSHGRRSREVTQDRRTQMNKERRKRIREAMEALDTAHDILIDVLDEEQEAFDNLPEGIQNGERGEQMSEYIETLSEQIDTLDGIVSSLDDIAEG